MTLYDRLAGYKDDKYKAFQEKLVPNIPPETIIGVRTPDLRKLAKEVSRKKLKSYVGNTLEVLVEEKDPSINKDGSIGFWGRTCFQAPGVDGRVYIKVASDTSRDVSLGSMVKVKITGSKEYDLLSNIVE